MPWEHELFAVLDDLEGQAEAAYDAERDAELADRSRAAYAEVPLAARLLASVDHEVALDLQGAGLVRGTLQRVGDGWCLVGAGAVDWVLPLAAALRVRGASDRALPQVAWSPLTRLGLGSALRRIADAGEPCLVHLVDGSRHEALLGRVGRDFVETTDGTLVPFSALAAVQRRG